MLGSETVITRSWAWVVSSLRTRTANPGSGEKN
jgi:hypothetical protein